MQVLIVEDDKVSRLVLRRILEGMGKIEVVEAQDGQEAWEKLSGGLAPDLCFLDINMPRLNGVELLKRIRGDKRLAPLSVCFCSAVRDRQIIQEAAAYRPDYYLLKPYSRSAIQAQVAKVRGALSSNQSLDSPEEVCARTGIDKDTYLTQLDLLLNRTRELASRLPASLAEFDVSAAQIGLDETKRTAQNLGARRLFSLADNLANLLQAHRDLIDYSSGSRGHVKSTLQQWTSLSATHVLESVREMRNELQALEQVSERVKTRVQASRTQDRQDLEVMINALQTVAQNGKLLASGKMFRSKSLSVPIKTSLLGKDSEKSVGGLTQKTFFSFALLDETAAEAVESCRKINDLTKLLSFPLDNNARWFPAGAIRLMEEEIAARNAQGLALVRQAVGENVEAFLARQESSIRQNLNRISAETPHSEAAAEQCVQDVLKEARERLRELLEGRLTPPPVFTEFELSNLTEGAEDAQWTAPFALLNESALLMRSAITASGFNRAFKFSTFDRQLFLQAMDIFGDITLTLEDPERASAEKEQLEKLAASGSCLRDKCIQIWRLIKGQTPPEPAAEAPQTPPAASP